MVTFLEQETNSQTTQWKRKHESTPIRSKVVALAGKRIATVQGRKKLPPTWGAPYNFTPTWKRVDQNQICMFSFFVSCHPFTSVVPERTGILPWRLGNFLSQYNSFRSGFQVFL